MAWGRVGAYSQGEEGPEVDVVDVFGVESREPLRSSARRGHSSSRSTKKRRLSACGSAYPGTHHVP